MNNISIRLYLVSQLLKNSDILILEYLEEDVISDGILDRKLIMDERVLVKNEENKTFYFTNYPMIGQTIYKVKPNCTYYKRLVRAAYKLADEIIKQNNE